MPALALGRNEDHQDNFFDDTPVGASGISTRTATPRACSSMARSARHWRLIVGVEHQRDEVGQRYRLTTSTHATPPACSVSCTAPRRLVGAGRRALRGQRTVRQPRHRQCRRRARAGARPAAHGDAGARRSMRPRSTISTILASAIPIWSPKKSRSFELGLSGRVRSAMRFDWSLHAFQTDIDQLIGFDPSTFAIVNIDESRIRGAELQGDWRNERWRVERPVHAARSGESRDDGSCCRAAPRRAHRSSCVASGQRSRSARWRAIRASVSTISPTPARSAAT